MTKADQYTFTTQCLNGIQIDSGLFSTFLDIAQMRVELARPWVWVRGEDATQTVSPGNTFQTAKTLAADFSEWYDDAPINLVDSNNNPTFLTEVPYDQRFKYKDSFGKFCVDYPNGSIYIMGSITQSYTLRQNYCKVMPLASLTDNSIWAFPVRFHKILGLQVAEFWKNGIDYDVFSNAQASQQAAQAAAILDLMTTWDSNLQNSMQRGKTYFDGGSNGLPNGITVNG